MSACLCFHLHISETTCPNFTKLYVLYVNCGRGWQWNALCISVIVDNVMFSHWCTIKDKLISSSSPGGCTRGEVWCLRLPAIMIAGHKSTVYAVTDDKSGSLSEMTPTDRSYRCNGIRDHENRHANFRSYLRGALWPRLNEHRATGREDLGGEINSGGRGGHEVRQLSPVVDRVCPPDRR